MSNSKLFKTVKELKKKMKEIDDDHSEFNIKKDLDNEIISEVIYETIDDKLPLNDHLINFLNEDRLKDEMTSCLIGDNDLKKCFKKQINSYIKKKTESE